MTERTYTQEEVDRINTNIVNDIAYAMGELGFSKEDINEAFAKRAETDEFFGEVWLSYNQYELFYFDYLYSRLPDKKGEGQATMAEPHPMEDLALGMACGEIEQDMAD